jgi:hypothetical protein
VKAPIKALKAKVRGKEMKEKNEKVFF